MTTTKTTFTAEQLAPITNFYGTKDAARLAGWEFEGSGIPEIGEQVVIYSRNNFRVGLVSYVTKTGTVSVQYVTPGGIAEAEKTCAHYQAIDIDSRLTSVAQQAERNWASHEALADGTHYSYDAYAHAAENRESRMAHSQKVLDDNTKESYIATDVDRAKNELEASKAKSVFDFVTVTTKSAKYFDIGRKVG